MIPPIDPYKATNTNFPLVELQINNENMPPSDPPSSEPRTPRTPRKKGRNVRY